MRHGKSLLAAVVVLTGLASSASAQGFAVAGATGNAFGGGLGAGGIGFNQGFTGYNSGYGGYNGGYSNFGYNNYGTNYTPRVYPQTYNNMGGLMGSIVTQTGGGNSYRYGYGPIYGRRRR